MLKILRWLSRPDARLNSSLTIYRADLVLLAEKLKSDGESRPPYAQTAYANASKLLEYAELARNDKEVELSWRLSKAAHRMEIFCLTEVERHERATTIYAEAQKKLDSWRKEAVNDLLAGEDGKPKSVLDASKVFLAAYILDEHHNNVYHKLGAFKKQLAILALVALVVAATWMLLSALLIDAPIDASKGVYDPWLLVSVALFGAMGAAISGLISLLSGPSRHRIPEQLTSGLVLFARLVIGPVSALVVYVFLTAEILKLGDPTPGLVLAAAFAAGFSERLVVRAVEAVGK